MFTFIIYIISKTNDWRLQVANRHETYFSLDMTSRTTSQVTWLRGYRWYFIWMCHWSKVEYKQSLMWFGWKTHELFPKKTRGWFTPYTGKLTSLASVAGWPWGWGGVGCDVKPILNLTVCKSAMSCPGQLLNGARDCYLVPPIFRKHFWRWCQLLWSFSSRFLNISHTLPALRQNSRLNSDVTVVLTNVSSENF